MGTRLGVIEAISGGCVVARNGRAIVKLQAFYLVKVINAITASDRVRHLQTGNSTPTFNAAIPHIAQGLNGVVALPTTVYRRIKPAAVSPIDFDCRTLYLCSQSPIFNQLSNDYT
jgi:hypothetical protein